MLEGFFINHESLCRILFIWSFIRKYLWLGSGECQLVDGISWIQKFHKVFHLTKDKKRWWKDNCSWRSENDGEHRVIHLYSQCTHLRTFFYVYCLLCLHSITLYYFSINLANSENHLQTPGRRRIWKGDTQNSNSPGNLLSFALFLIK